MLDPPTRSCFIKGIYTQRTTRIVPESKKKKKKRPTLELCGLFCGPLLSKEISGGWTIGKEKQYMYIYKI